MQAYSTTKYPVFEADQVLTQKHLNNIVSFLEEQDRLTRTGLIGIGVYCGFEITYNALKTEVTIGCGKAVTSLGFEITWEEKTFTLYHDIELSSNFLNPDFKDEPHLKAILKKEFTDLYAPLKNTKELLEATTSETDKITIPTNFFNDKIIVLLLETSLINQKNCIAGNCDDKGKRIEFNLRPLVVDFGLAGTLDTLFKEYPPTKVFHEISLPRYNVPFTNLVTGNQVLDGFKYLFDAQKGIVTGVSDQIKELYNYYKGIIGNNPNLPSLDNVLLPLQTIINSNKDTLNVQYVWDWLHDVVAAHNEIVTFIANGQTLCCVNEGLFPFHVVLGNTIFDNNFRTPHIKTGNTDEEKGNIKRLAILFERLVIIVNSWSIYDNSIKITPSRYGDVPLSRKSIPYYYNNVLNLNKTWDPIETFRGRNDKILSYHSDIANYTNLPSVKEPLLYDIEPYNFYRIEGHIGKNYLDALTEIATMRERFNLPFNVVALNAVDFVGKEVDISKYDGDYEWLESEYDLARTKFLNITEYVINWITLNQASLTQYMSTQTFGTLKNILSEVKLLLKDNLKDFLPVYKDFYEVFKNLNVLFLLHRFCILFLNNDNTSLKEIAEDLIDHLDEINDLFLEDPFTVIYDEAQKRWETAYKELFLSTFLQKNKGIEHNAGVTRGGTFILVYSDSSVFTKKAPTATVQLVGTIKQHIADIDWGEGTAQTKADITKTVTLRTDFTVKKMFDASALKDCKNETENIKANLVKLASYNMGKTYPKHVQDFFTSNLATLFQFEPIDNEETFVNQKVILADFFLPYLCCSGSKPISINIEGNPITPFPVTGGGSYCSNDSGVAVGLGGSESGVSYQLYKNGVVQGAPVAGTGGALSFGVQTNGTYTVQATNGSKTNAMTGSVTIAVNAAPAAITGSLGVQVGMTTNLTDATPGGTWSSSNTAVATVSNAGVVTGIAVGTATITYTLSTGCIATTTITVNPSPAVIAGLSALCVGTTTPLTDATVGGTWSSSNTAVATINNTGVVTGISAGTTTITYTLPTGSIATKVITVNPPPTAITGLGSVQVGSTIVLTSTPAGGTWSSNKAAATVNNAGVVTGIDSISTTVRITYTLPTGCFAFKDIIVAPAPVPTPAPTIPIKGSLGICVGVQLSYSHPTLGGVWSIANPTIAKVVSSSETAGASSSALVEGLLAGITKIIYTLPTGAISLDITVNPPPAPIIGQTTVAVGASITLSDPTPGGTWSSANSGIAIVGQTTGVVTGKTASKVDIFYTLPTGCRATISITVVQTPPVVVIVPPPVTGGGTTTLPH